MKMKKNYVRPLTAVTRVELESPICGGSVEITNPNEDMGRILDQSYNKEFGSGNEFTADVNTEWTSSTSN